MISTDKSACRQSAISAINAAGLGDVFVGRAGFAFPALFVFFDRACFMASPTQAFGLG